MTVKKININQSEPSYYIASDIYDVTANNNNATFDSLSALLSSENLSTLIPTSVRCGGMTIRFVQSSDNNYVQYRLMSNKFTTTESDWQGVDDEPTAGSDNIVKSGGVFSKLSDLSKLGLEIEEIKLGGKIIDSKIKNFFNINEDGFFLTDKDGNIGFCFTKGVFDALGIGNTLLNIIQKKLDINTIMDSISDIMDNISDISTYLTSLKNKIVNVNEEGLNITDSKGNIAWYIKPIITEQEGLFFIDENFNIGVSCIDGEVQFANLKNIVTDKDNSLITKIALNTKQLEKLKAETSASVKSLAGVVNPNVESKEIQLVIPESTNESSISDGIIRVGLHYGSKGNEVLSALNGYAAINDELYFDNKCRKDFSDIRAFDENGNMLPIKMQSFGNYEVVADNRLRRGQHKMLPNHNGQILKLGETDNKLYISNDDATTWVKLSEKVFQLLIGIDVKNNAYLFCGTNSVAPSTIYGNIVKVPYVNGSYNLLEAKVVCDLGYDNYDYHTTISLSGTATVDGTLTIQCSPSNDFVYRYNVDVKRGDNASSIAAKIAALTIKDWTISYTNGSSVTLNSARKLIYINPAIESTVSGITCTIETTKDGAERASEASCNSFVSYTHDNIDYVFIGQYQEATNANIRKSTDCGETFSVCLDNQQKYDITGRNAQHIHHIDYDSYHNAIYVGIDHSAIPYGPTVLRSFDNGLTWQDIIFSEDEVEQGGDAYVWNVLHRGRDYTPTWFAEDGSFSLGGGETSELDGYTLLRIDNSDATTNEELDKHFKGVINTHQRLMEIKSLGDDFIVACLPSGATATTNQIVLSTDKGNTWTTIWSHEDPLSYDHVGNGNRYLHKYTKNGETMLIVNGVTQRSSFPSLRIYKGGNHYYGEMRIKVGDIPSKGKTITIKSGYMMEYPQLTMKDRDLIKPDFAIRMIEGYGDVVSNDKGKIFKINGKHSWEDAILSLAKTLPIEKEYGLQFGLNLKASSYISLGKLNIDTMAGFSVSFWINFKGIGSGADNKHYVERNVVIKWGNTAIFFTINGICVGDNTNFAYRYNYKGTNNDMYMFYCLSFSKTDRFSGTSMPIARIWMNDKELTKLQLRGTASRISMDSMVTNDVTIGCVEPKKDYYFCNNDDAYISDVRFYKKELSPDDVYKIYNGFGVRRENSL